MVTNVTSLTGNGLKDWLIQQLSAAYLLIYFVALFAYIAMHQPLHFADWHYLFSHCGFKIFTMIAVLMLTLHAWIGIWTVTTDYIKSAVLRFSLQMLVAFWLLSQLIGAIMIFWGQ